MTVPGRGQRAGVVAAGQVVAQVCHEAVGDVAERARDEPGERGELRPGRGQGFKAGQDGGRACEQGLRAAGGGREDKDGLTVGGNGGNGRGESGGGQACERGRGLGRGEAQAVGGVTAQQPAHGGVAERAATVEEDEQMWGRLRLRGWQRLSGGLGRVTHCWFG